jgi:DNA (cytosine-5)-methyltransferase 1
MDLGFREENFLPVMAIDVNQRAVDTYNHNDPRGIARQGNLARLTDAEIVALAREAFPDSSPRGVIGGPPCQSVSISNVHNKRNDPRKRLLLRYAKIVKALNEAFSLDFFVFENVVGIKSGKHKRYFRKVTKTLEDAGFKLFEGKLNAKHFGVAQDRARIIIVGINTRLYPNINFDFPEGGGELKTVADAIGGLPEPAYFKRDILPEEIPHHPNHWTMNPRSPKFTNRATTTGGRSFRRLDWERQSWTVAYGNREMHVHPGGARRVSIYEAMRLQGFPENYRLLGNLSEQVTQVSNAVPPPLARAIAAAIRTALYAPVENIQNDLLTWFAGNQRSFPWRETTDPYRVMVAEKLLQQTAATNKVVTAYMEIVEHYPDIESLAKADVKELRRTILPLGFLYRANELPRLAKEIIIRHSGQLPDDLNKLLSLPGIGDYAARATLSFAFGKDVPIVDTNVARWLYRLYGIKKPFPNNPARNKELLTRAASLIPLGNSRNFNLAVLDLCASICTARRPDCARCPVQRSCSYGRSALSAQTVRHSRLAA